jgi:hypothetical protein
MISLILTGRNDNYGGFFEDRLLFALGWNTALLRRAGIAFEVIFVEWNPIEDRPYVSLKVAEAIPEAHCYIVPSRIHEVYCTNPHMPFCEMPAKNVGIQQAKGDRILILNADILLSAALVARIADIYLDPRRLYRAQRIDIESPLDQCEATEITFKQLRNGEERNPPVDYLGAGGDFCLATAELFRELGGFDERVRFTTRAKDWSFFLNAKMQEVEIAFVGTIYHIDHGEGFRHAAPAIRDTSKAHFGSFWNIEYELPYSPPVNWGLSHCAHTPLLNTERIHRFIVPENITDHWDAAEDKNHQLSLLPLNDFSGKKGAQLMHLLLATEISTEGFSISLNQPDTFAQWSVLSRSAKLQTTAKRAAPFPITESPESLVPDPSDGLAGSPAFNPFLLTRLFRAYAQLRDHGLSRILIYGAGEHTRQIFEVGIPTGISIVGIVQTQSTQTTFMDCPCFSIDGLDEFDFDGILISSVSFETEMIFECAQRKLKNVYGLYSQTLHSY